MTTYLLLRRAAVVALLAVLALLPVIGGTYITSAIAVQSMWLGLCAVSVTFLASYGGMISLAQTGLFGVAGLITAALSVQNGWDPWAAAAMGIAAASLVGLVFGALASSSTGTYFLMITLALAEISYYLFAAVPAFGLHEGINGVFPPAILGDPVLDPAGNYYFVLAACVAVYLGLRYLVRTPFGIVLQGVRDDPIRMTSLGYNVRLHRTLIFAVAAGIAGLAGVLSAWNNTRISADSVSLAVTIGMLEAAVIGGLYRLEGAWAGALVVVALTTYGPAYTSRYNTFIGLVFLAIVLISPGGIVGMWNTIDGWIIRRLHRRPPPTSTADPSPVARGG